MDIGWMDDLPHFGILWISVTLWHFDGGSTVRHFDDSSTICSIIQHIDVRIKILDLRRYQRFTWCNTHDIFMDMRFYGYRFWMLFDIFSYQWYFL